MYSSTDNFLSHILLVSDWLIFCYKNSILHQKKDLKKKKKKCQESKWKYKVAFCTVTGLKLSHHKSRIAESFQEFMAKIVTSLRVICGKYFSFHLSITLNNLINNIQSSSKPVLRNILLFWVFLINSIAITIKNMTRRHRLRNILFLAGVLHFLKTNFIWLLIIKRKLQHSVDISKFMAPGPLSHVTILF